MHYYRQCFRTVGCTPRVVGAHHQLVGDLHCEVRGIGLPQEFFVRARGRAILGHHAPCCIEHVGAVRARRGHGGGCRCNLRGRFVGEDLGDRVLRTPYLASGHV